MMTDVEKVGPSEAEWSDSEASVSGDEPIFHALVVFSLPGDNSHVQAVAQHLAGTVQYGLGLVVQGHTGGSRGVPCRLELGSAAAGTEPDERPFDDDAGSGANEQAGDVAVAARRQAPSHARRRRVPDGEATIAATRVCRTMATVPPLPPHIYQRSLWR